MEHEIVQASHPAERHQQMLEAMPIVIGDSFPILAEPVGPMLSAVLDEQCRHIVQSGQ